VPFTLVHAGKYRTEDKLKIQRINKLNATQKQKQTMQNTAKQNYPGLVGQETRLVYSASKGNVELPVDITPYNEHNISCLYLYLSLKIHHLEILALSKIY